MSQDDEYESYLNAGGQLPDAQVASTSSRPAGTADIGAGDSLESVASAILGPGGVDWASTSGFADAASGGETHAAAGTV